MATEVRQSALKHSFEECEHMQDAGDKAKDVIDSGKEAVCSLS